MTSEAAVKALGYAGLSGSSKVALGALNQFGLIRREQGLVRISDLGLRVVSPADEVQRQAALKESALQPELFRELWSEHGDASEQAIRSYLIAKKGFAKTGAEVAAKSFKSTMASLKDQPSQTFEPPMSGSSVPSDSIPADRKDRGSAISIDIPVRGGVLSLRVSVRGAELSRDHVEAAQRLLELAAMGLRNAE